MNEGELVSGAQNLYDRTNLAGMWRDGYLANSRIALTPDKYRVLKDYTQQSWQRHIYKPKFTELEQRVRAQRRQALLEEPSKTVLRAVGVEE